MRRGPRTRLATCIRRLPGRWLAAALIAGAVALLVPGVSYATAGESNVAATGCLGVTPAAFPAMGTGFGGVPFDEAARQMAVAYRHYLEPPHRIDWDVVIERHKSISYDGPRQVIG